MRMTCIICHKKQEVDRDYWWRIGATEGLHDLCKPQLLKIIGTAQQNSIDKLLWCRLILELEGLGDWKLRESNAGPYCWIDTKTIDLPSYSWEHQLFLHELAHALYPHEEQTGYGGTHYHGGRWADTFGRLISKYMQLRPLTGIKSSSSNTKEKDTHESHP